MAAGQRLTRGRHEPPGGAQAWRVPSCSTRTAAPSGRRSEAAGRARLRPNAAPNQKRAVRRRIVGEKPADRVRRAWQLTAQREPTPDEVAHDLKFIEQLQATDGLTSEAAWNLYCLMCLNTNEFLYVD